nr:PREDICTED: class E basic helix-loop-helix protein 40-like [Latimeria chalumnae]|eukprot:XP_005987836.1 PREDICTED: class E basic helix-loop-helix protein 40-like [Latimeria chalumnae]
MDPIEACVSYMAISDIQLYWYGVYWSVNWSQVRASQSHEKTLGHLEKAVVLELTLKHVRALTSLIEQQQQKIIALQNGLQVGEQAAKGHDSSQEMFCSGFQMCAKEVLQYLTKSENGRDLKTSNLINHLHRVAAEVLQDRTTVRPEEQVPKTLDLKDEHSSLTKTVEVHGRNCVPVIQRTFAHSSGEQSGSDTDTDSGYGGESEKSESKSDRQYYNKKCELKSNIPEKVNIIKRECEDPPPKRYRIESPDEEPCLNSDMIGSPGNFLSPHHHQPPLCLPFYVIPPSATAYLPMLEKCWYPASMPVLYPGLPPSAAALTGLMNSEKLSSPLLMPHRVASPVSAQTSMDSSTFLQSLKQVSPLNLETKD